MAARNFTVLPPAHDTLPCRKMRATPTSGAASRFALTLTACGILLLAAGALTVRYIFVDLPGEIAKRTTSHLVETARGIADEVARAFQVQPKVTVEHQTVVEQQASVLKLVTLEKSITERRKVDDTWLQSTKTLEVECDFVVQTGFDLAKPFVIDVANDGATLRVTLPPARVLGVDVRSVRFLRDEDGLWNKLTPADRESALRDLRQSVELNARKSDLLKATRELAEKQLKKLLTTNGRTVTFEPESKQ
jgi:hypothetical protein